MGLKVNIYLKETEIPHVRKMSHLQDNVLSSVGSIYALHRLVSAI